MRKKNKIRQHTGDNSCLSADKINDYLTGRLNTNEMDLVRKHIDECEICAEALEGYKNIQLKDSLLNTVEQLNKQIDEITGPKEYKLQSFTKKIIAYSSLAATILILTGLFLLIRNLRIRNNLVTDKLVLEKEKQRSPEVQEKKRKAGSVISYDSFAKDDTGEKDVLKEEILPVTSKSQLTYYDKSEKREIIESEAIDNILETEVAVEPEVDMESEVAMEAIADMVEDVEFEKDTDKEMEEIDYKKLRTAGTPAAREAEVSRPLMYDRSTSREKAMLAKKGYSKSQEVFTGQMQSDEELLYEETIFPVTDELPVFENNGLDDFKEYIQKNLRYPANAKKSGIEGKVFVKFAVDTTGRVVDTEIINGTDSILNKEALRVVNSSPLWTPGKQDGKPVKVSYIIPVIFRID